MDKAWKLLVCGVLSSAPGGVFVPTARGCDTLPSRVCGRRTVNAPIPQQLVQSFSLLSQEKSAEIILYRESVEWEG